MHGARPAVRPKECKYDDFEERKLPEGMLKEFKISEHGSESINSIIIRGDNTYFGHLELAHVQERSKSNFVKS